MRLLFCGSSEDEAIEVGGSRTRMGRPVRRAGGAAPPPPLCHAARRDMAPIGVLAETAVLPRLARGGGTDSGALPPGLAALPWLAVSVRLANTAVCLLPGLCSPAQLTRLRRA